MGDWRKALSLAIVCAAIVAAALLLHLTLPDDLTDRRLLSWLGSAGCFGFLLGGVYAFDPASDLVIKSSAVGRVSFGLVASLLLSALWRWPFAGVALAVLGGVVLSYSGMSWAKYVDYL